jgi:hypothetical protein
MNLTTVTPFFTSAMKLLRTYYIGLLGYKSTEMLRATREARSIGCLTLAEFVASCMAPGNSDSEWQSVIKAGLADMSISEAEKIFLLLCLYGETWA